MSSFGQPPGGGFGPPPGGSPPGGGFGDPSGGFGPPGGDPSGGFGPPGGGGFGPPGGAPPGGGFGAPPGGGQFGPPPGGAPMGGGQPQTDPLAIASLAVGVFSLITCFCCGLFGIPFPIAAVGLGGFSLSRINKEPERYGGKGLAIAGMAIGAVSLVLVIIATIIGAGGQILQQLNR